jgi:hypothetical protein
LRFELAITISDLADKVVFWHSFMLKLEMRVIIVELGMQKKMPNAKEGLYQISFNSDQKMARYPYIALKIARPVDF